MLTSDKRQFLDPITTISRIILLHFSPEKTKLRIYNHCVILVEDSWIEKTLRNINGDNRGDICVLFPIFIRFIELYLIDNQKKFNIKKNNNSGDVDNLYKYLHKLGEYSICGLQHLQQTYEYDNVVFTLQYFINLVKQELNFEYSDKLLPEHLKELTKNNLLDNTKVQQIWNSDHIVDLTNTFEKCFNAKQSNDNILLESNLKKIYNILDKHDELFKQMIDTDSVFH